MKTSVLLKELEDLLRKYGDLTVHIDSFAFDESRDIHSVTYATDEDDAGFIVLTNYD